jgi:hypothetical protein
MAGESSGGTGINLMLGGSTKPAPAPAAASKSTVSQIIAAAANNPNLPTNVVNSPLFSPTAVDAATSSANAIVTQPANMAQTAIDAQYLSSLGNQYVSAAGGKPADMVSNTPNVADFTAANNMAPSSTAVLQGQQIAAGVTTPIGADPTTADAYALIQSQVDMWFGPGTPEAKQAADFLMGQMSNNIGPNQALVDLRQQGFYLQRFAGNTQRSAAKLNVLSEAEYLALENQYSTLMESYGQKGLATKAQFANLIGNDISSTELNNRLDLAVNQVKNADPTVMATLKAYYPGVSTNDIVGYFLSPNEALVNLQQKVNVADIGAAATQQGFNINQARAQYLQGMGVNYTQAQTGYGKIAEVLPTGQKLSDIYGKQTGINYNQTEAEKQYLLNNGAAVLEQQKLTGMETAQFSGRSGIVGASAQAGYSGSLGKSLQGKF